MAKEFVYRYMLYMYVVHANHMIHVLYDLFDFLFELFYAISVVFSLVLLFVFSSGYWILINSLSSVNDFLTVL